MPNLVIDTTTNNKTLQMTGTSWVYGNVNIPIGATLTLNNLILNMLGSTFTNNGAVTDGLGGASLPVGSSSQALPRRCIPAPVPFGAPGDPLFGFANINRGGGLTIDASSPTLYAARLLAFSGSLTNASKVSITQVGTNVITCQRGGVAQLPAGTLDVSPSYTGGSQANIILVYSQASNAVTTGAEVPASRTAESLQLFNTNGLTISGGPLTLTGNGGAAPDTIGLFLGGTSAGVAGGPLNTSAANLVTVAGTSNTGALLGGSENAYVNGPIARVLPGGLTGTLTYVFPTGKSTYKGFELVNPTTGGGSVTVQAEVFDVDSTGIAGGGLDDINHNRYWNATITAGGGNFTSSSVRVTELNSTGNALGQSATQNGAYGSIGGTLLPATVQSSATVTSLGYFVIGRLTGTPTFPGGTYTIGAAGNYTTLTAAMADLSGKIITGPILYSLRADYSSSGETFPIVVPANGGSNANNTMTIKPALGVSPTIVGSSASGIIELLGADYVTIDGSNTVGGTTRDLTIQNTNAATPTAAVWLASLGTSAGATFDTIKNSNIRANGGGAGTTTSIFGIFAGGTTVATNGNNNNFLTIQNNQVDTAYEAIAVRSPRFSTAYTGD